MKLARGQDCTVRIPGICCHNPETVVLAHYRMAGLAGVGMKPSPLVGAWACASCHNEIDGRTRLSGLPREQLRLIHAEACLRTLARLIEMGRIKV